MEEKTETAIKGPKTINESILLMTSLLSKTGIEKDKGGNKEINYKFRGIDDIRNTIAPLQSECNLLIVPSVLSRTENGDRKTKHGGFSMWVNIELEFKFINTVDDSNISVKWCAEAVDYSDKATQKAISQAYKTVCINVFNIPTEGEQDGDENKIEIAASQVGVFKTDEVREDFIQKCLSAFESAETESQLKDSEGFYHDQIVIMANSEHSADQSGAAKLRGAYVDLLKKFKSQRAGL